MACLCVEKLQSLCLRLKVACRHRCRVGRTQRQSIKISDPFDFKHLSGVPDGLNQDEINVLREKAAASRMIAIEDQEPQYHHHHHHRRLSRPSSRSDGGVISSSSSHATVFGAYHSTRPQPQVKSRVGYRGLASAAAAHAGRGLSYSALAESRSSPASRSYVAVDDMAGSLSPASSINMSTRGLSI